MCRLKASSKTGSEEHVDEKKSSDNIIIVIAATTDHTNTEYVMSRLALASKSNSKTW